MNNAKEIAEKTVNALYHEAPMHILARAYLELEKKLQFTNNNWPHENKLHEEITKLKEENEKLKKSREVLMKAVEFYGTINTKVTQVDEQRIVETDNLFFDVGQIIRLTKTIDTGETAREALKADDEIIGGK